MTEFTSQYLAYVRKEFPTILALAKKIYVQTPGRRFTDLSVIKACSELNQNPSPEAIEAMAEILLR